MKTETLKTETTNDENAEAPALSPELLHKMNAYWRAANYLSVPDLSVRQCVAARTAEAVRT